MSAPSFYNSLSPEQQAGYVPAALPHQYEGYETDRAAFEASLTAGQLDAWNNIKAEAEKLGHSVVPEKDMSALDQATCGLRTMFDKGLSDDPQTRAIQEQTIANLGGEQAARQLAQDSLNPDFSPSPEIQEKLLEAQNARHTFISPSATLNEFFGGQPPEIAGASGGGALPDSLKGPEPTITDPGLESTISPMTPNMG